MMYKEGIKPQLEVIINGIAIPLDSPPIYNHMSDNISASLIFNLNDISTSLLSLIEVNVSDKINNDHTISYQGNHYTSSVVIQSKPSIKLIKGGFYFNSFDLSFGGVRRHD